MTPSTEPSVHQPPRPLWRTILTPRWFALLVVALAVAAVMCLLGVWQLDVYQSKTAAATAKRTELAPVPLQTLFSLDAGLPSKAVGRRVAVSGTWGPAADQIFVSDRRYEDRDGFWVVTPLLLSTGDAAGGGGAVMVIRGWVPTVTSSAARPPAGPVRIVGAVAVSEAEDASGAAAQGRTLRSLRIPTIVHLVNYRLYDAFVVLASAEPMGTEAPAIVPAPSPPTDHAGLRNVAYAVQWWVFALFTLWMWARMLLDAHRSGAAESSDAESSDGEPSGTVSE